MNLDKSIPWPSAHTSDGSVVLGDADAPRRLIVFEDPQCPFCRQFEEESRELLRSARLAGSLSIEYRMRCFLGIESVRADNALVLAAEENRFDELRMEIFVAQPPEGTGGFTTQDLLWLGERAGLVSAEYETGVKQGRYEVWALKLEEFYQEQDPQGTPAAWLDGQPVDSSALTDPRALGILLQP